MTSGLSGSTGVQIDWEVTRKVVESGIVGDGVQPSGPLPSILTRRLGPGNGNVAGVVHDVRAWCMMCMRGP